MSEPRQGGWSPRPRLSPELQIHEFREPATPTALVIEMPQARTAAIDVYVRAGSAYESGHENGIAHLLEHVVLAGSERYPTRKALQREFDQTGGFLDAVTQKELTQFSVHVLPEQVPRALELLAEVLVRPSFAAEVVESERQIVLEEMLTGHYDGAQDPFAEILWGTSSLGLPIIGDRSIVERIDREALRAAWRRWYTRDNMVLCVAGAIDPRTVEKCLPLFAGIPEGPAPDLPQPQPAAPGPRFRCQRDGTGVVDTYLMLRTPGRDGLESTRVTHLTILAEVLQAHIYQHLIGPQLPIYYLTTGQEVFTDQGCVYVYLKVMRHKYTRTINVLLEELDGLRRDGLEEAAVALSRRRYELQVLANLADPRVVAARVGADRLLRGSGRALAIEDELSQAHGATAEVLGRAMDELFQPSHLSVLARGGLSWWEARKVRKRFEGWLG